MKFFSIYIIFSFIMTMETVRNLDLERFMGKWYVISNIPNFIEKNRSNSYDTYSLNQDGTIDISYYGDKNGKTLHLKQKAEVKDTINNSLWQLRITKPYIPFLRLPYKVILLDDKYDHMVVGYDGSTMGWIMCRDNHMDDIVYDSIMKQLEDKFNYKRSQFFKVEHDK